MATPEDGTELVDVRTKWKHEGLDFTPWLAKNLHLLGDTLGMELEPVQTEVPVGPYYLDILAREADDGALVAIENQLEETDLSHLGQLITYATGCGAHVAIWVAPEFGYEHAQALHRLNEWTNGRIRFFGVKVEVIKKAGGVPTPRFRKVVYPGGWSKEATLPSGEMPPTKRRHHEFFQPLVTKLLGEGFADKAVQYFDHTGRIFPSSAATKIQATWSASGIMVHGYLSMFERGTALSETIGYSTNCKRPSLRSKSPSTLNGYGTDSDLTLSSP